MYKRYQCGALKIIKRVNVVGVKILGIWKEISINLRNFSMIYSLINAASLTVLGGIL